MDDYLKKIKKLTLFMKKEGILHLKQGDIELQLSPAAINETKSLTSDAPIVEENKPTDMDVLFWSSPGNIGEELNG